MESEKSINREQYVIVAARRQVYDTMLWQAPVLSLTAQAFLFTIALGHDSSRSARIISAMLALIAALASIQLMAKHRYHELEDSRLLEMFETSHISEGFTRIHGRKQVLGKTGFYAWLIRRSSYRIWVFTLVAFAVAAIIVLIRSFFAA